MPKLDINVKSISGIVPTVTVAIVAALKLGDSGGAGGTADIVKSEIVGVAPKASIG